MYVDAHHLLNVFVEKIALNSFRNYEQLSLDLAMYRRIALIGANAQGKSSFLEALYTLAFAGSFRTSQPVELIKWNGLATSVQANCLYERGDDFMLGFEVRRNGKRLVQVNHAYQKKLVDYIGLLKLVLFSQQDLDLIKGQPARRRLFLDLLLIQVRPGYYALLQFFNRVLKQRNSLLRELKHISRPNAQKLEELELWDIQLSQVATKIIKHRQEVLSRLMGLIKQSHIAISGLYEELEIEYKPSLPGTSPEEMLKILFERRKQDIGRGLTSLGPHRDDLTLRLGGHEIKYFGSQGQIRTAALAMKVGELLYVQQALGEYPILLLDDVFSELDIRRQQLLVEQISMPGLQVFMTTTHLEPVIERLLQEQSLIIHVSQGKIHRR